MYINCTQGTSQYVRVLTYTIGNYNNEDAASLSDIHTCVSKDLRPGFEGHDVVEISWTPDLSHGMYIHLDVVHIKLLNFEFKRF